MAARKRRPLSREMLLPLRARQVQMLSLEYHLALAALRSGTNGLCEAGTLLRAAYHGRFMCDGSDSIRLCSTQRRRH